MDQDVEPVVGLAPARRRPLGSASSDWTSHGSTNVEPIESASGRTRRSIRLSTDEKPTSAPSSWSARAIPQAIEWSLATPKISAFLPSSRPIRVLLQYPGSIRGRSVYATAMRGPTRPPCATAMRGVRALLLDLDGVIVVAGEAVAGLGRGDRGARAARHAYRIVTNTSLVSRRTLSRYAAKLGNDIPPERFQSALSASAAYAAEAYPRPADLRAHLGRRADRVRRAAAPDPRGGGRAPAPRPRRSSSATRRRS